MRSLPILRQNRTPNVEVIQNFENLNYGIVFLFVLMIIMFDVEIYYKRLMHYYERIYISFEIWCPDNYIMQIRSVNIKLDGKDFSNSLLRYCYCILVVV